jgi:hypothetical protein
MAGTKPAAYYYAEQTISTPTWGGICFEPLGPTPISGIVVELLNYYVTSSIMKIILVNKVVYV